MPKRFFSPAQPKGGYIGHRGIAAFAPENTLSSFKLAAKNGIDWVEFDLRVSKDNQLFIFHDDNLDRTTNGQGLIQQQHSSYLANLDAGSWFDPRFSGEKIPAFLDILPMLLTMGLFLNIELKLPDNPTDIDRAHLLAQTIDMLSTHWPKDKPWPLMSSFDWAILHPLRTHFPDIPLGFLTEGATPEMIPTVAAIPNAALHCHYPSLTPQILSKAKEQQVPILVYTVNDPNLAQRLLADGVFGVFSDNGGLDYSMLL